MPSLTPQEQAEITVSSAVKEGAISGVLMASPAGAGLYTALNFSPSFVKATNWQSRTALVIMPCLFAFAAGAESKLVHRMKEMASEAEHSKSMAEWTKNNQLEEHKQSLKKMPTQRILAQPGMDGIKYNGGGVDSEDVEKKVLKQFRESVLNSGVRVVSGESLGVHYQIANFWQENPFKILTAVGVPTVLYIFKGRAGQDHLQFQMKLMHTRVFGQFAVLSLLLSLMGFKEYMDRSGKYITEADVQSRVGQMQQNRAELLMRLQRDKVAAEKIAERRRRAHETDLIKAM